MQLRHWIFLTFLLLCAPCLAADATLPQQIAARVQTVPVLRGEFTQARTIEGFSKPLRSSGRFIAARDAGVYWETQKPFPGALLITAKGMRESSAGAATVELDATQEPALRQVNRILLALLQGDLAILAESFKLDGRIDAAGWQLSLTPHADIGKLLTEVKVAGNQQIERIEIAERNGDRSLIEFSHFSVVPAALEPAEQALFAD